MAFVATGRGISREEVVLGSKQQSETHLTSCQTKDGRKNAEQTARLAK